jgi:cell division septum initiation protein DivIVA
MPSERMRILELALESLHNKKKQIDDEIAELSRELKRGKGAKVIAAAELPAKTVKTITKGKKRPSFSKEERSRRAARMTAYWIKWRKDKAKEKK